MANPLALHPVPSPLRASPEPKGQMGTRSTIFLLVILTAQLMVVLDTTIVNVALPHIQAGLGFTSTGLSWVLNAYLLTFGGLLLLGARAGDLLGRRTTFLSGIAVFTVSSLLGGLAATSWQLLAARALQGAGAALAAPSALALLTTVFSEGAQRVRAIGLFTTVSAAGGAVGLVAGGILTELVSWRWVMFVNVPIGIAVLVLGRTVLTETSRRHGRFDLAGALASTLGMSAVVLGLVEAASAGWGAPITVGALSVGLLLLGLFVRVEARAEEPILPLRLFADSTRTAANLARGLLYAGMFGMFFFLGRYLQDVQHYSPLRAGLCFLPVPATVFLSSQATSRVLVRLVPVKVLMLSGIGCSIASLLLLTQLHADSKYVQILGSLVLMGIGAGTSLVTLTTASLAEVSSDDAGAASGLVNVVQQVGAALGLAVLVTVSSAASATSGASGGVAAAGTPVAALSGLDVVFGASAIFAIAAFALVASMVRLPAHRVAETSVPREHDDGPEGDDAVDRDHDRWLADAVA
jgi:EmrB/QacA subfamily drug resistance transporter